MVFEMIYPPRQKPIKPGFDDKRLVLVSSLVRWTPDEFFKDDSGEYQSRVTWVENFTAIMCKSKYSIDTYTITSSFQEADKSQPFLAVKQAASSEKIEGFTDDDLVPLLKAEAERSRLYKQAQRDVVAAVSNDSGYVRQDDPLFILMSQIYGKSGTAALINQDALLEAAPRAFSGAMVQIFHNYFTLPTEQEIAGKVHMWENRLNLQKAPVALMITSLGLMICISIGLVFLRPHQAVPLDPQSILAKAKVLAASPALSSELLAANGQCRKGIQRKTQGKTYQTACIAKENKPSFTIFPNSTELAQERSKEKAASDVKARWQPLH